MVAAVSAERHDMPNGQTIWYFDAGHHYCVKSPEEHTNPSASCWNNCPGRVPGISTISKNDGSTSNDGLLDWAHKEAKAGRYWKDTRSAKGDVGTDAHSVLQQLSEGVTPIMRTGYDQAAVDWFKKRRPEVVAAERVVYSDANQFAGRFDLRARLTAEPNHPGVAPDLTGKDILIDAKSSNYIGNGFHVQLAGYDLAGVDAGYDPADAFLILQLYDDGGWDEWEGAASHADFLTALGAYQMGKRLGSVHRAMQRDREKVREAKKAAESLKQAA